MVPSRFSYKISNNNAFNLRRLFGTYYIHFSINDCDKKQQVTSTYNGEIKFEMKLDRFIGYKEDVMNKFEMKLDRFINFEMKLDMFIKFEMKLDMFIKFEMKLDTSSANNDK